MFAELLNDTENKERNNKQVNNGCVHAICFQVLCAGFCNYCSIYNLDIIFVDLCVCAVWQ